MAILQQTRPRRSVTAVATAWLTVVLPFAGSAAWLLWRPSTPAPLALVAALELRPPLSDWLPVTDRAGSQIALIDGAGVPHIVTLEQGRLRDQPLARPWPAAPPGDLSLWWEDLDADERVELRAQPFALDQSPVLDPLGDVRHPSASATWQHRQGAWQRTALTPRPRAAVPCGLARHVRLAGVDWALATDDGQRQTMIVAADADLTLQRLPGNAIDSGDLDGDGTDELLLCDPQAPQPLRLYAFRGHCFVPVWNGQPLAQAALTGGLTLGTLRDHDGDGLAELLVADPQSGQLQAYRWLAG
ncbi:MAG: hypothetical protein IT204_17815 [Fimbriimonadaceae bacterium]|nr:hypothetical protein [Fimbriimonadaceae bacterium]